MLELQDGMISKERKWYTDSYIAHSTHRLLSISVSSEVESKLIAGIRIVASSYNDGLIYAFELNADSTIPSEWLLNLKTSRSTSLPRLVCFV